MFRNIKPRPLLYRRWYTNQSLSTTEYHSLSNEYLETLVDYLDEQELDVLYVNGVLTLNTNHGTYVINKQPPNKQIWFSSPISGPKRFEWDQSSVEWKSKGIALKALLESELKK
jgi:frataxin